mgnify:CR=1 FL=1
MNNIENVYGFKNMDDRIYPEYRQKIYNYLKGTMSSVITEGDLNVMVELVALVFADMYMRTQLLPWEIDIDKCSVDNLKELSSNIGYIWSDRVGVEEQRESIKLFCLIRKYRGTKFGLSNLIRVFGQTAQTLYSRNDLRGVEIIEYDDGHAGSTEPSMYPGDIKVRMPEFSKVLRDAVEQVRPAGRRIP